MKCPVYILWLTCILLQQAYGATLMNGVDAGIVYNQDYFRNIQGGRHKGGAGPGRLDLYARLDGNAWGGSGNNFFYLDLMGTVGGSISGQAGDLQILDNVEAPNTFKLFEAWYQHSFGNAGLMMRVGMQDYNTLFNVLDAAGILINSSFGLDPSIGQVNPSIFPVTTVGGVIHWQAAHGVYVMGAVFDGVPGLPGHPHGTHIHFLNGEGVFASLEAGIDRNGEKPYKLAVGGWYQTSEFVDPAGRPRNRNHGLYAIAQTRVLSDGEVTMDAFLQLGLAAANRNILDHYIGAGITVTGLVPLRPDDSISLGMARAHTSRHYRNAVPGSNAAETALEITWQAALNDHLVIQPDIQYIINPGAEKALNNAWLLGVRGELSW
jgi:porin